MKIVVLDGYPLNPGDLSWEGLSRLGEITVYEKTKKDEIVQRIGNAQAVFTNKIPLTKEVLRQCRNLRFIGVLATGYNIVNVKAAKEQGIVVTNVPDYGTDAVGQFAIGLLLEICLHIGQHSQAVREGKWSRNGKWCFWEKPLIELTGKTMGIIGFGRIGQSTGRIAKAMGMKVLAYSPSEREEGKEIATYVDKDTLFAQSDVISLHCPLFPETEGMINRDTIHKMKDGVILLNNSRGGLIVEKDLAEALETGKVYAAGLDVVSVEPIREDNVLLKAKNCFITPHISWASKESRQRLLDIAVRNLKAFQEGNPQNVVGH